MAEMSKKFWRYSTNRFDRLNPGDLSVAAKWPLIDSGDKVYSASTAVVAPSGDPNDTGVNTIAGDSTAGQHGLNPVANLTAELHEFVVYARAGNKNFLYVQDHTVGATCGSYFNLSTGALGTVGALATADIRNMGNSWFRCSIRFTGTAAAHTFEISPCDADGAVTMTGGDAATVNVYLYRPGVFALQRPLSEPNDPEEELRTTDDGDLIIGGVGEDLRALPINVSRANATRSTYDRVLLVQVIDAAGAVGMNLSDVTAADGATAAVKSILIGGKDGVGNQQDALTGTAGQFLIDFYSARPGESVSDDWVKQCAQSHLKVAPASLGSTAVTTDTVVLGPIDVSTYGPFNVFIENSGAALTACKVETSPDGVDANSWSELSVKDADEVRTETLSSPNGGIAYKFPDGWGGFLRVRCSTGTATNVTAKLIGRM